MAEQFALQKSFREGSTVQVMRGFPARMLLLCTARATSTFPVPVSPVISTVASVGPTRRINPLTLEIDALLP